MIWVSMTMSVLPEKRKELMQTLLPIIEVTKQQKGCMVCRLYQGLEDECDLILLQEWEMETAVNRYLQSNWFHILLGTAGLLNQKPRVATLHQDLRLPDLPRPSAPKDSTRE